MKNFQKVVIKTIVKAFARIFSVFVKQSIIFESYPDFTDNTRCVYNELVNRGYNKKYHFIWQTGENEIATLENGEHWKMRLPHTPKQFILSCSFFYRRKVYIIGNRFFTNNNKDNIVFFLNHGAPMKATKGYYEMPHHTNYVLSLSNYLAPIASYQGNVPMRKMFAAGFPKNDEMFQPIDNIRSVLNTSCKKIVVWYPTYRQQKKVGFHTTESRLPILGDKKKASMLNEHLKKINVLIVAKPHFAQDLSYLDITELSNLKFIDDNFFIENGFTSYQFVSACDALLTDYSSIYYDYLLCDKPIGVLWEDIEEYKRNPGFSVDLDYVLSGAEKIYNFDELLSFLSRLINNVDNCKEKRKEIRENVVEFCDNQSTVRVTDFIIEKSGIER